MKTSKYDEVDRYECFSLYNIENLLEDVRTNFLELFFDNIDSDIACRAWRILDMLFEDKLASWGETAKDYKETDEKCFEFKLKDYLDSLTDYERECLSAGIIPKKKTPKSPLFVMPEDTTKVEVPDTFKAVKK